MTEVKNMYWLWQWKQIRDEARRIIKKRESDDLDYEMILLDCETGSFPKSELEERLMKEIMKKNPPIDKPNE